MKKSTVILAIIAIMSLVIGITCLTIASVQAVTAGYNVASKSLEDSTVWSDASKALESMFDTSKEGDNAVT